jgi:FixJ family two-component response regulator
MSTELCVFIVDDDYAVRDGLALVVETAGLTCQTFESAEHFLQSYSSDQRGCLLLDLNMPGLDGLELQAELIQRNIHLPIIFLTGYGDIPQTVRAIKAGAVDFLTKPVESRDLIRRINAVLQTESKMHNQFMQQQEFCNRLNSLTPRELELLPIILAGLSNKQIGRKLDISYRTVEVHRARILNKTGVANLLELGHLYEASQLPPKPKPEVE